MRSLSSTSRNPLEIIRTTFRNFGNGCVVFEPTVYRVLRRSSEDHFRGRELIYIGMNKTKKENSSALELTELGLGMNSVWPSK